MSIERDPHRPREARMKSPALPWLLAGALLGWIVVDALRGAPEVVDLSEPLVEQVEAAEAARDSVEAEVERVLDAYADSVAAWSEERRRLRASADRARADAYRLAEDLRVTLDTAGVRMLDEIQAEHREEVAAVTAERDTFAAEVLTLEGVVAQQDALIAAQRVEIATWAELDAERRRVNDALRSAIRKQRREKGVLALAAIGLAVVVIR